MNTVTYTQRARGGYYAHTDKGVIVVTRLFDDEPDRGWFATSRNFKALGQTRKEAVELVYNQIPR